MTKKEKAKARTRAQVALLALEVSMQQLEAAFSEQKPARDQLAKVRRWLNECFADSMRNSRLSSGAERDADKATSEIDRIKYEVLGGDCTTIERWAAWQIAVDALISDVRNTWEPAKRKNCWRYLCQTFETWVNGFLLVSNERDWSEEKGGELYIKAFDCMP